MARQKVPGVAVAVVRKGQAIVAKGYGLANVEHNVPVTPRDHLPIRLGRQAVHRRGGDAAGGGRQARAV